MFSKTFARSKTFPNFLLILLIATLSACATTQNKTSISTLDHTGKNLKILLMPIDIELSLLTAGGQLKPRADWTENAEIFMRKALDDFQLERNAKLIEYGENSNLTEIDKKIIDVEKLHSAVGVAILTHEYMPAAKLPSKGEEFNWTLGPEVKALKEKYDADYALFLFVRDSYSSSGRVFLQIFAAIVGVGITGGQQLGFASLVDLETGKISWFNRLFSSVGDMRTQENASKTVSLLLDGLPE